jgi:hypothetical protein
VHLAHAVAVAVAAPGGARLDVLRAAGHLWAVARAVSMHAPGVLVGSSVAQRVCARRARKGRRTWQVVTRRAPERPPGARAPPASQRGVAASASASAEPLSAACSSIASSGTDSSTRPQASAGSSAAPAVACSGARRAASCVREGPARERTRVRAGTIARAPPAAPRARDAAARATHHGVRVPSERLRRPVVRARRRAAGRLAEARPILACAAVVARRGRHHRAQHHAPAAVRGLHGAGMQDCSAQLKVARCI